MDSESLRRIWTDWKNVIVTTAAVVLVVTSLWWLPPIVALFEPNPEAVGPTSTKITDAMWWIVFIIAAQSIFSNRKKRQQMKMEQAKKDELAPVDMEQKDDYTP